MNYNKNNTIVRATIASITTALAVGLTAAPSVAETLEPVTIQLMVDGHTETIETVQDTVADVLAENEVDIESDDVISPSPETPVANVTNVAVVTAKTVHLKVGNNKSVTKRIAANTVAEVLTKSKVKLAKIDTVSPSLSAKVVNNSKVIVNRVAYKNIVKSNKVKFKTVKKKTNKLYKGQTKITKKGKYGVTKTTFQNKFVNGKLVSTKRIITKVAKKSQTRIVLVGTKKKPTISGVWAALAQCESGGNPRIVSSNGLYHGLFQFSVGTWHSVGGKGLPSQASPAEQLKRAKILQARSGWGQWPHCSSKLGLR